MVKMWLVVGFSDRLIGAEYSNKKGLLIGLLPFFFFFFFYFYNTRSNRWRPLGPFFCLFPIVWNYYLANMDYGTRNKVIEAEMALLVM